MSVDFTLLETRCALTILRTARDELRERQVMLAEKLIPGTADKATESAALELENRIYVIQTICQKLWVAMSAKQRATDGTQTFKLADPDLLGDGLDKQ